MSDRQDDREALARVIQSLVGGSLDARKGSLAEQAADAVLAWFAARPAPVMEDDRLLDLSHAVAESYLPAGQAIWWRSWAEHPERRTAMEVGVLAGWSGEAAQVNPIDTPDRHRVAARPAPVMSAEAVRRPGPHGRGRGEGGGMSAPIYRISWEMVDLDKLHLYSDADPCLFKNTTQVVPNSAIPDEHWRAVVTRETDSPWQQYDKLKAWAVADTGFVRNVRLEQMASEAAWHEATR